MDTILVSVLAAIAIAQVIWNAHYAIFDLTGHGRLILMPMTTAVAIYAMAPMAFGGLHWTIVGGIGLCALVPILVV